MLWMSLTSGGTQAWIYTGQKKKPTCREKTLPFSIHKTNKQHCLGWNQVLTVSSLPSHNHDCAEGFYIWLKAQAHRGLFLHWAEVSKFEYFSPCSDDCAAMQRPDKISSKWFCWIYHRARSSFTCSLHSSRSFQHLRISKGVTQQCCVVWNPVGKQCCIQQETYLCMHWCNA